MHVLSLLSLPRETSSAFSPDPDALIMLGKGKIGNLMCHQSSVKTWWLWRSTLKLLIWWVYYHISTEMHSTENWSDKFSILLAVNWSLLKYWGISVALICTPKNILLLWESWRLTTCIKSSVKNMAVAYSLNITRFCLADVYALIFSDKLVWLFINGHQLSFKLEKIHW